MAKTYKMLVLAALLCVLAAACAKTPTKTADIPRLLPQNYRIAVAPFTQPLNGGQLITGRIPEAQGYVPPDALTALDTDLREILRTQTKRSYEFLPVGSLREELAMTTVTNQPSALAFWQKYGKNSKADYLLIPMILDWHDREGSQAGVERSAHVRMEMFLLNNKTGLIQGRTVFEEKQVGLIDNLLGVRDFFRRKGQWITSQQLAKEGMLAAIKELGL